VPDRSVATRLVLATPALATGGRTVRPTDGGVRTAQAGALLELRDEPAAPEEGAKALTAFEQELLGDGTALVPGQVLVLALPNPHDDADPQRPALEVAGDAAVRVVALDAGGRSLADATVLEGRVEVPARTARVALVGIGTPVAAESGAPAAAGLTGWHAGTRVAEIAPGTAATPGGLVRGPARGRGGRMVASATMPTAGEIVRGVGLVETTVPTTTRTLAVALERGTGTDDELDGLVIGLHGLRRRTGPDGELRPRVVASGPRTTLLYAVEEDPATAEGVPGTAIVSIASDDRWEAAGIAASTLSVDRLAEEIAATSLEALVAPLVSSSVGTATVTWTTGGEG
jgi:hypothetical protein